MRLKFYRATFFRRSDKGELIEVGHCRFGRMPDERRVSIISQAFLHAGSGCAGADQVWIEED